MEKALIKVCGCHDEQVPLIWTFAFPGAEYWCPACGYTSGMFGAGIDVELTDILETVKEEWKEKTAEFLNAVSTFSCSELKYEGKQIKPSDLPAEVINKLKQIKNSYTYKYDN